MGLESKENLQRAEVGDMNLCFHLMASFAELDDGYYTGFWMSPRPQWPISRGVFQVTNPNYPGTNGTCGEYHGRPTRRQDSIGKEF